VPAFDEAASQVIGVDPQAATDAASLHDTLTKPAGSLGRIEAVGIRLAAVARMSPPPVPAPAAVAVFAGDHGVLSEGVSPWPQEVTAQMVANFCQGGAAVNVLAGHVGAEVLVVDAGVVSDLPDLPGLRRGKVRAGSGNIAVEPAMTPGEARLALDLGATVAGDLLGAGARCLLTGDMGIANTTPSAALIAAFTGRSAAEVTGRGTGIDDDRLAVKVAVVERALRRMGPRTCEPIEVLAQVGGLEIAALAGYIVAGAAARVPVLLDGVIAGAAALAAAAMRPEVAGYLFAGHRSSEPGAGVVLAHLGIEPLLDLGLRLGEGTGACLALPLLQAAAKVLRDMASFGSAGVSDRQDGPEAALSPES